MPETWSAWLGIISVKTGGFVLGSSAMTVSLGLSTPRSGSGI